MHASVFHFAALAFLTSTALADAPGLHPLNIDGRTSQGALTLGSVLRFSDDGSVFIGRSGSGNAVLGNAGYRGALGAGAPVLSKFTDGTPVDLSGDGNVVVGTGSGGAYRRAGASLASLHPAGFSSSTGDAVSADGSVAAGTARDASGLARPFRWTQATGTQVFDLPENTAVYSTLRLSRDGSSIFAVAVRSVPTVTSPTVSYGFFHWDAAGARTEVAAPVGYEFTTQIPEFSLSDAGAAAMLVRERARFSPYPAQAVLRWTPGASTLVPLPQLFGHDEAWSGVLQSGDGSVLVAFSARRAARHAAGTWTDLGPFKPAFMNAEGSVILGSIGVSPRPAAWTAATGLVDLTDRLGLALQSQSVSPGPWASLRFAIHGDHAVIVARVDPTPESFNGGMVLAELALSTLAAAEPFTGTLLTEGTATKPSAAYAEKGATRAVNRGGPPPPVYGPSTTSSAKLRITASMEGVDLNSLTADSPVELRFGPLPIFKGRLGDDTSAAGFSPGDTSAEFAGAGLTVRWTTLAVTFEVARSSLLFAHGVATGTLPVRLRFGARDGLRNLQFSGSFTRSVHNGGDGPSFRTAVFSSKGAFTAARPAITAAWPKDGSTFNHRHLDLPLIVNKTAAQLWMRVNGGDWIYLGIGSVTPPPVLLGDGANTIEIEARDGVGGVSALFKRTYQYLPKAGAYTVLLDADGEAPGFITLALTEDGAFTGKLTLDGKALAFRAALDAAGHAELQVSRGASLAPAGVALDLAPGVETNVLTATVTIPQPGGANLVAGGSGGRAHWNAPLHPSLAGAFGASFAALFQPGAGTPPVVTGTGHMGLRLLKGATLTARGKLADGTPFTGAFPLDDALRAPIFLRLLGGKARVSGTLAFDFSEPATDCAGTLRWRRDASAKGPFAAGWDCTLGLIGSRTGYPSGGYSMLLRFSGGGLAETASFRMDGFRLPEANPRITLGALAFSDYAGAGVKGTFKAGAGGKAFPFEALQLAKGGQSGGFFLTPAGGGAASISELQGIADGASDEARFNSPVALAIDAADNLFIVDRDSHTIRKRTPDGAVTTLAGRALYSGAADGIGAGARFSRPQGIAADAGGNVFVADTLNYAIRKITADGTVTTFAGVLRSSGNVNGTGAAARFTYPAQIVLAGDSFYVSGDLLRRITPAAVVSSIDQYATVVAAAGGSGDLFFVSGAQVKRLDPATNAVSNLAGHPYLGGKKDGRGEAARFGYITGLASDAAGNVFVADAYNHTIRKITPDGTVTTFAGKAGATGNLDGNGPAARFRNPQGLAFDNAGNLYVTDTDNHCIRRITPAGDVTTIAGGH